MRAWPPPADDGSRTLSGLSRNVATLLHDNFVEARGQRVESGVQPGHRPRQARGASRAGRHHRPGTAVARAPDVREDNRLASRGLSVINLLGVPAGIEDVELEMPDSREPAFPADLG